MCVLCLAPDHRAMQEYYRAPIDRLLPIAPGAPLEQAVQAQQFGTVLFAAKSPARPARQDRRRHRPGFRRPLVQLRREAAGRRQNHRPRPQSLPPRLTAKRYGAAPTPFTTPMDRASRRPARAQRRRTARCRDRSRRRRTSRSASPSRSCARQRLHPLLRCAPLRDDGLPHLRLFLEVAHRPLQCRHHLRTQPRQYPPSPPVDQRWHGRCGAT